MFWSLNAELARARQQDFLAAASRHQQGAALRTSRLAAHRRAIRHARDMTTAAPARGSLSARGAPVDESTVPPGGAMVRASRRCRIVRRAAASPTLPPGD